MGILISNRQNHHPIIPEKIREAAREILGILGHSEAELSLVLTDDTEIAALNREYLGHEGPTNVISFPMLEGDFSDINPHLLGDVVISLDTAQREGYEAGITMEERLTELLVHGILHLLGYDHENEEDEAEMEEKSQELMEKIRNVDTSANR